MSRTVHLANDLMSCVPFTPRTFAANNTTNTALPATNLTVNSIDLVQSGHLVSVITTGAHHLLTGDSVTIVSGVSYLDAHPHTVTVTSATSFTIGPFAEITADASIASAVITANIWFSRAAVFAKTHDGEANAHALKLGYHTGGLLPIDLASDGEYGFIAPDGRRMNLADLLVEPASAGVNGLICILY